MRRDLVGGARRAGLATVMAAMSVAATAASAGAQESALARRVAAAPGDVRLEYATRAGTCGDGRTMIGFGRMFHSATVEGYGTWRNDDCRPGDARVTLVRREGRVIEVRSAIGGRWSDAAGVTSLGRVPAAEAASYLLSLAEAADPAQGQGMKGALWAAALADSTQLARRYLALATNEGRSWNVRRTAMQLAGATGDATIVPELERLARSGVGDDGVERKKDQGNVARAAAEALVAVPERAGMEALLRLAADAPSPGVRKATVFHAAQSGDPRGARLARTVAEDARQAEEVRNSAIFALLNRDEASAEDGAWARQLFPRLTSDKLRDPILMGLAQHGTDDDRRWVLGLARDESLSVKTRRAAIFWSGQGDVAIEELLGTYRALGDREVKEHVIFALSQREGDAATNALVDIARKDADRELRRKAVFWLGQRKDARAMQVLTELINQ